MGHGGTRWDMVGHTGCALGTAGVPTVCPHPSATGGKLILHPAGSKAELLLFSHPTNTLNCSVLLKEQCYKPSLLQPPAPVHHTSVGQCPWWAQARVPPSFCSSACGNCSLILLFLTQRLEMQHSLLPQRLRYQSKSPNHMGRLEEQQQLSPLLYPTHLCFLSPPALSGNN